MRPLDPRPCLGCKTDFKPASGRIKFCSHACYATSRTGIHGPGNFRAAVEPHNKVAVGTERLRKRRNRNDAPRWFVKIAEPNVWRLRAVVVWEAANGPTPAGMVVHHINHDSLDDRLDNLMLLSRAEHLREHRGEHNEALRSESMRRAWVNRRARG